MQMNSICRILVHPDCCLRFAKAGSEVIQADQGFRKVFGYPKLEALHMATFRRLQRHSSQKA